MSNVVVQAIRAAVRELESGDPAPEPAAVALSFAIATGAFMQIAYGDGWREHLTKFLDDPETDSRVRAMAASAFGSAH